MNAKQGQEPRDQLGLGRGFIFVFGSFVFGRATQHMGS